MYFYLIILRILHIGAGILWAGTVIMNVLFLMPAAFAAGESGREFMRELIRRKFPKVMLLLATITTLSGILLIGHLSGWELGAYFSTNSGKSFGLGSMFGIVGWAVVIFAQRPASIEIGHLNREIGEGEATPEQAAALEAQHLKLSNASRLVALLVSFSIVLMSVARYLN